MRKLILSTIMISFIFYFGNNLLLLYKIIVNFFPEKLQKEYNCMPKKKDALLFYMINHKIDRKTKIWKDFRIIK